MAENSNNKFPFNNNQGFPFNFNKANSFDFNKGFPFPTTDDTKKVFTQDNVELNRIEPLAINTDDYLSAQNDFYQIITEVGDFLPLPKRKFMSNFTNKQLVHPEIPPGSYLDTFYTVPKNGIYLVSYTVNIGIMEDYTTHNAVGFALVLEELNENFEQNYDVRNSTSLQFMHKVDGNQTTLDGSITTLCRLTKNRFIGLYYGAVGLPIFINKINLTVMRIGD